MYHSSVPGRDVITWYDCFEFYQPTIRFTVQMQLVTGGFVTIWYSPGTTITGGGHTAVCGFSPGNGAPNPGSIDISAAMPFNSVAQRTVYEEWGTGGFDLPARTFEFDPNGSGGYLVLNRPACAFVPGSFSVYGTGCPPLVGNPFPDFYELFTGFPTFDLGNTSIELIPLGGIGYLVIPCSGSCTATAAVSPIAIGDDQVVPQALPFTFPHPGGATANIGVCSNGYLYFDGTTTAAPYIPDVLTFLGDPASLRMCWSDFNPAAGGTVETGSNATEFVARWTNVPEFGAPANLNNFEVILQSSGRIVINYGAMTMSAFRDVLTGYTTGNGAPDPGNIDISASMPFLTGTGVQPLVLSQAGGNPTIGAVFPMRVSAMPAGALAGFLVLGTTQFNPGIDLTSIGMPGCHQYLSLDVSSFFVPTAPATVVTVINIPNRAALIGVVTYSQAAVLAPSVNALGVAASNGGVITVGTF